MFNDLWNGIIISESLEDPTFINDLNVWKATISKEELDLADGKGSKGRWHLYWVTVDESCIDQLKTLIKEAWYAHFWKHEQLVVVFKNKTFEMLIGDKRTWKDAIAYGKSLGISEEELDFYVPK
jgi:hypothetical protein